MNEPVCIPADPSPECQNLRTPPATFCFDVAKTKRDPMNDKKTMRNGAHEWSDGAILVTGDSMIGGLEAQKMRAAGEVKVRVHSGANIRDMYDHLEAHLAKKTSKLVIHIATNNTVDQTSEEILGELIELDKWVENKAGGTVKRFYSMPIERFDHAKATITTRHLQAKIRNSGLNFIDNSNINKDHLGKKLHHLNDIGTKILATNIIHFLKRDI